jgi:hypothetical protein
MWDVVCLLIIRTIYHTDVGGKTENSYKNMKNYFK